MDHLNEFRIPEDVVDKMQKPGFLEECLDKGMTLQNILGFTSETMEKLYSAACNLFHEGKFKQAEDAFVFLTTLNPNLFAFWLGLAMSYHHLEEFEQALLAYSLAANVDSLSPLPDYYAASCHFSLGNRQEALHHIEDAIKKCRADENHNELLSRCELMYMKIQDKRT